DAFLAHRLMEYSRSYIQKAIHAGRALVNGAPAKANYRVKEGDRVELTIVSYKEFQRIFPEDIPLDIRYEDDDVLVINKQAGLMVHPAGSIYSGTLVNALLHHWGDFSRFTERVRPGLVHRLDRDTSGLMVVAKHERALVRLARQFEKKTVRKQYVALVNGAVELDESIITIPIGRHPRDRKKMSALFSETSKEAVTRYRVTKRYEGYTACDIFPLTGRTHQIRVHMAHIGHPLLGDTLYGGDITPAGRGIDRHALHASLIAFTHPVRNEPMEFTSPVPEDMQRLLIS
ncbi:MAG: RluA family pseudouridine synthase, partial [Candidatus Omnitrophica bacterium]|nr:RluA family pseudouridine synthase [Candidatus Omnitrophota bacterium]